MTTLLAVLLCAVVAALLAQGALHAAALKKLTASHVEERAHLVAALIARTPGEFAGLLAAQVKREKGTRKNPADPVKDEIPPEAKVPMGL